MLAFIASSLDGTHHVESIHAHNGHRSNSMSESDCGTRIYGRWSKTKSATDKETEKSPHSIARGDRHNPDIFFHCERSNEGSPDAWKLQNQICGLRREVLSKNLAVIDKPQMSIFYASIVVGTTWRWSIKSMMKRKRMVIRIYRSSNYSGGHKAIYYTSSFIDKSLDSSSHHGRTRKSCIVWISVF